MSIPEYNVRSEYVGTGSVAAYTFDFKIAALTDLLVIITDINFLPVSKVRGDDTSILSSVVFDAELGGGTVTLKTNLTTNYNLTILLAADSPIQRFEFRNKGDFTLKRFEQALDALGSFIQRVSYLSKRAVRTSDNMPDDVFDTSLPFNSVDPLIEDNVDRVFVVGDDNASFKRGPTVTSLDAAAATAASAAAAAAASQATAAALAAEAAASAAEAAASALPPGGAADDIVYKNSTALGDYGWKTVIFDGVSALTGGQFTSSGLLDTLSKIIRITYTPPTISLSAPGNGSIREKGTSVASVALAATTTKKSDPIVAVRLYQGVTLLYTDPGPNPAGGVSSFTYSTPFTDNITFSAQVDDNGATGGPTTVSTSQSFTFVYPYYNDAAAVGRTPAQVGALTKSLIASTATVTKTMTATAGQVFYFAYPASYGVLISILDVNGFETFPDWTLTVANITGLDGNAISYNIYAFNNPVTAGSYQYTFKR